METFYRSMQLRESDGSAICATENPVLVGHYRSLNDGNPVNEVLLMTGAQLPKDKTLPLLDTHSKGGVDSIKGSMRNLRLEDGALVGDPDISSAESSIKTKVEEKHIRNLSVGYDVNKSVYVPAGKSKNFGGRDFVGPVVVATRWTPTEVSMVLNPADTSAKFREESIHTEDETSDIVSEEIAGDSMEETKTPVQETKQETVKVETVDVEALAERKANEKLEAIKAVRTTVRSLSDRLGIADKVEDICEQAGSDINKAHKLMNELVAERQKPTQPAHVVVTADSKTKTRDAARDLLTLKAVNSLSVSPATREKYAPKNVDPQFSRWGYAEVARFLCEGEGVNVQNWTNEDILKQAVYGRRDGAMNTMGSLASLFQDVANKSLEASYADYIPTFQIVGRRLAPSKTLADRNVLNLSTISRLDAWLDGDEPKEKKLSSKRATIKVVPYANNINISWHAVQSDDLDFISTIPAGIARQANMTHNKEFWAELEADPTMQEDAKVLFHADHNNKSTGSGGITIANVATAENLLRQQTAMDGSKMGLTPRYLVAPGSLSLQARQVCGGIDPTATLPSGVINPYSVLSPVIEGELTDTNSRWYLFPDQMFCAISYCYLQGYETPQISSYVKESDDSLVFKVRFPFAVGATEYRGVARFGTA